MKTAIFMADGMEEVEALTVVDLLRRAKIPVDMVSMQQDKKVTGSHKITVLADCLFQDVNFEALDLLILPGGMPGTKRLMSHAKLMQTLVEWNEQGKWIAAICAAPMILGENWILKGKQAVCYPGFETSLKGATVLYQETVVDQNIITSRGLGTAIEFSSAIIAHFLGDERAEEIKAGIIYRQTKEPCKEV